jgi:hypothetical protein
MQPTANRAISDTEPFAGGYQSRHLYSRDQRGGRQRVMGHKERLNRDVTVASWWRYGGGG